MRYVEISIAPLSLHWRLSKRRIHFAYGASKPGSDFPPGVTSGRVTYRLKLAEPLCVCVVALLFFLFLILIILVCVCL